MPLPEKFKYAAFKSRTDYTWRRRGSNMEQVDTALKLYWEAVKRASESDQLATLLRVIKECNGWLKKKKDKNTAEAGMFKTRWDEVSELGRAAYAAAGPLRAKLEGGMAGADAGKLRTHMAYEQNRARHLAARTTGGGAVATVTKALSASYTAERSQYAAQKKVVGQTRANPVSMSTVHEMHGVLDEEQMAYDPKFAQQYGTQAALTRAPEALTVKDMEQLDRLMVDAEGKGFAPFIRHVLYLDKSSRMPYMALVVNGLLYQGDGATPWNVTLHAYAMDEYGNLFIDDGGLAGKGGKGVRMNHTTFLAGKNVICAGTISVRAGKLIRLTTNSGHYKPRGENMFHCLEELRIAGVLLDETTIDLKTGEFEGHETDVDNVVYYRGDLPTTLSSYYTRDSLARNVVPTPAAIPGRVAVAPLRGRAGAVSAGTRL